MNQIKLNSGRIIGDDVPVFTIAEIGINHNGDFELAKHMIEVAAKTGVDAVKFQKRTIDEMYIRRFLDQAYHKHYSYGETYGAHKRFLEFSDEQFLTLQQCARDAKVDFIVSGFDFTSFEFIEKKLNVNIHKIPSPFVTHFPLLKKVAQFGKPLILSTGMHSFEDILAAVKFIRQFNNDIIVMQATTLYPCPDELVNLRVIQTYKEKMKVLVGYSSHDKGVILPAVSVVLGACVIEKHFTLDRTMTGPDHAASVEPRGMEMIVKYAHKIERGLGDGIKTLQKEEEEARKKYGVSIVSKTNLLEGQQINESDITVKCPGGGISPVYFWDCLGKKVKKDIAADEIIYERDLE
jgi:sialic acid synthase